MAQLRIASHPKAKIIANASGGDGLSGSHNRSIFLPGYGADAAHHKDTWDRN